MPQEIVVETTNRPVASRPFLARRELSAAAVVIGAAAGCLAALPPWLPAASRAVVVQGPSGTIAVAIVVAVLTLVQWGLARLLVSPYTITQAELERKQLQLAASTWAGSYGGTVLGAVLQHHWTITGPIAMLGDPSPSLVAAAFAGCMAVAFSVTASAVASSAALIHVRRDHHVTIPMLVRAVRSVSSDPTRFRALEPQQQTATVARWLAWAQGASECLRAVPCACDDALGRRDDLLALLGAVSECLTASLEGPPLAASAGPTVSHTALSHLVDDPLGDGARLMDRLASAYEGRT